MDLNFNILPCYEEFMKSKKRTVLLLGGAGSGKSYVVAQKILLRIMNPFISDDLRSNEKDHLTTVELRVWAKKKTCNWLVVRRKANSSKDSTFALFIKLIDDYKLNDFFKINLTELKITYLPNGNFIIFKGLDYPERLKSVVGITNVWVEEAAEIPSKDNVDELYFRMREKCNYNQLIMTFNPISSKHWLKELWDSNSKDILKIKTTFNDNYELSEEWKQSILRNYPQGTFRHSVYVLGEWGSIKSNSSLFSDFSDLNINQTEYDFEKPLHISFDFNVQPYSICQVYQIDEDEKTVNLIDEIITPYPATTKKLITEFCDKYSSHTQKIFVYGDASGKNNTTTSDRSNFDQIFQVLKENFAEGLIINNVMSRNPDIIKSVAFSNHLFSGNFNYKIFVSVNCQTTIEDLMNLKTDRNGSKLKEIGKTEDGVTYEKWGHASDTLRYFLIKIFYDDYQKFIRNGKQAVKPVSQERVSQLNSNPEPVFNVNFGRRNQNQNYGIRNSNYR